jgi:uncharacterized membrane protein YphA (DoxX/SURF4 family)
VIVVLFDNGKATPVQTVLSGLFTATIGVLLLLGFHAPATASPSMPRVRPPIFVILIQLLAPAFISAGTRIFRSWRTLSASPC